MKQAYKYQELGDMLQETHLEKEHKAANVFGLRNLRCKEIELKVPLVELETLLLNIFFPVVRRIK